MNKVYIANGYNSYTNKELIRAFQTEQEADSFISGLTDPHIHIIKYKSTTELVNHLLQGAEK
jgi:hypothetical protein